MKMAPTKKVVTAEEQYNLEVGLFDRRCEENNAAASRRGVRVPTILDWPRDEYFWYLQERGRLEQVRRKLYNGVSKGGKEAVS
jgi:hypothetical protein